MFTGIITDLGRVRSVVSDGDSRFEFTTSYETSDIDVGASICCSGVCLTVIETGDDWFAVSVSEETLSITTLRSWKSGTTVNFERAMKLGDELSGHIVSGHVDGIGQLLNSHKDGSSTRMTFAAPDTLAHLIAAKGSITIDGVSLTVNAVTGNSFDVNIIPHTQEVTTLGKLAPNNAVNLEIDMLARYVARLLENGVNRE